VLIRSSVGVGTYVSGNWWNKDVLPSLLNFYDSLAVKFTVTVFSWLQIINNMLLDGFFAVKLWRAPVVKVAGYDLGISKLDSAI
jgi:hypothetical protein